MKYDILTVLSLIFAIVIAMIAARMIVLLTSRFFRLFKGESVV